MATKKIALAEDKRHPLAAAIDEFDKTISMSKKGMRLVMAPALNEWKSQIDSAREKLDKAFADLTKRRGPSQIKKYAALDEAFINMDNVADITIFDRLIEGQFVGLFAIFDGFIGDLIGALFSIRPELYSRINGELKYSAVFACNSISDLKRNILEAYIDAFRRKSYSDQFVHLEELFGLSLRKFERWPAFIECAQRRNLVTHCRGVVSDQYIKCCKEVGYQIDPSIKPGNKLEVDGNYFISSASLVQEIGIMLAQTLWRKIAEKEIDKADEHISEKIYQCLKQRQWRQAVRLGEFAYNQKKHSTEQIRLIICVNYCIGLRQMDERGKVAEVMNAIDLTGCMPEFRLAKQVLLDQYDSAAETMVAIGRKGEILTEQSYHIWPLFLEFRATKRFQDTYKKIYRRDFVSTVESEVEETKARSEQAINQAVNG